MKNNSLSLFALIPLPLLLWGILAWVLFAQPATPAAACTLYPTGFTYAYSLNNSPNVNGGSQGGPDFIYAGNAAVATALNVDGDNAVALDGVGDRMNMASHGGGANLNQGQIAQVRTYMIWFNATNTTGTRQIWEHGGATNGAGMYIRDGVLYGGVWKADTTTAFLSTTVMANSTYFAVLQYDPAASGTITMYVNSTVVTGTGIGATATGTNPNAIGGVNGNTRRDDASTGAADFAGVIDDFVVYYSIIPISTLNTIFVPGGGGGCHPTAVALSGQSTAVSYATWLWLAPSALLTAATAIALRRRRTYSI